jgi:hypothetical protein
MYSACDTAESHLLSWHGPMVDTWTLGSEKLFGVGSRQLKNQRIHHTVSFQTRYVSFLSDGGNLTKIFLEGMTIGGLTQFCLSTMILL